MYVSCYEFHGLATYAYTYVRIAYDQAKVYTKPLKFDGYYKHDS